jgi:hypothetical protein
MNVESDSRHSVVVGAFLSEARGAAGSAITSTGLTFSATLRSSLRLGFSPGFSRQQMMAQYVGNQEDPVMTSTYGARYLYGEMDYRSVSFTTRLDWTLTPKLTLQTFAQPLFAVAHYTNLKELAQASTNRYNVYGRDNGSSITYDTANDQYLVDPDPAAGADPFTVDNPDFNFKSLRINMVMRWEYRPGSTFYFVWTQDRSNDDDPGGFDLGRDAETLMAAPGENIFMVKMAHWFDT